MKKSETFVTLFVLSLLSITIIIGYNIKQLQNQSEISIDDYIDLIEMNSKLQYRLDFVIDTALLDKRITHDEYDKIIQEAKTVEKEMVLKRLGL